MGNYYLSVIVPVYNVEKYLRQCIDSILDNHCRDLEIILVDDGSKDGCGAICDEYAKEYKNVDVIHKENGGLVSARKAGAKAAGGKYITFVDGDDYVDSGLYASVIGELRKDGREDSEILIGSYKSGGIVCANDAADGIYDRNATLNRIIPSIFIGDSFKQKISPAVWIKYFPRDMFINGMGLVDDVIRDGEDVLFSTASLMHAGSVRIDNSISGYNYRVLDSSMSHEYNRKYYENASGMCRCLEKIMSESDCAESHQKPIRYAEAYMFYRYVDRELFCDVDRSVKERFDFLSNIMNTTVMGQSFMQLDTVNMDVSRMLKLEIKLLQGHRFREVYMLRKAERLVHR